MLGLDDRARPGWLVGAGPGQPDVAVEEFLDVAGEDGPAGIEQQQVVTDAAQLGDDVGRQQVERSALGLLRSGLDSTEVREAVLLLVERDTVRRPLVAAAVEPLADRPGLVTAVTSTTEDPGVRHEVRAMLDSAGVRELIWRAVDDQVSDNRFGLIRRAAVLFVRHPSARRLGWALRRHGVLRELRHRA